MGLGGSPDMLGTLTPVPLTEGEGTELTAFSNKLFELDLALMGYTPARSDALIRNNAACHLALLQGGKGRIDIL